MFHVKHFYSNFLSFSAFSVLVALIVGRTIQPKCQFSAQPIGIPEFYFTLPVFVNLRTIFTFLVTRKVSPSIHLYTLIYPKNRDPRMRVSVWFLLVQQS